MGVRIILTAVLVALTVVSARAVEVQQATSPAGTAFWLVEEPSIPIVSIQMSFKGGARLDPPDRPGLSRLTVGLLDDGAGDLDAVAFSKERDRIAARYGFGVDHDSLTVSATMLKDEAQASAALLGTVLAEPRFDPEAIERMRAQMLSGLASDETDPGTIAGRTWYARAFPEHPYGRTTAGTPDAVRAITRAEIVATHARLLARARASVAVVGAVTVDEAGQLIDTILAGMPEGGPAAPIAAEPAPPPSGIEVVPLSVPQSVAVWGQTGLRRDDPDFFAAFVMNHILGGGGFSSRLMTEVREKRGLAYSVYAYLSELDGAVLYIGRVQTANDRIAESLDVVRAEWRRMAEEGVSQDELDKAKRYLTGAFPLRFDSNAKIAGFLVFAQEAGLGADYIDRRNGLIEAVSVEDIRRVAARLLAPDALSIVVVGEPAGL
ncbi:MAG: pitrilysin family protein [Pseudomonadota bacterium]